MFGLLNVKAERRRLGFELDSGGSAFDTKNQLLFLGFAWSPTGIGTLNF